MEAPGARVMAARSSTRLLRSPAKLQDADDAPPTTPRSVKERAKGERGPKALTSVAAAGKAGKKAGRAVVAGEQAPAATPGRARQKGGRRRPLDQEPIVAECLALYGRDPMMTLEQAADTCGLELTAALRKAATRAHPLKRLEKSKAAVTAAAEAKLILQDRAALYEKELVGLKEAGAVAAPALEPKAGLLVDHSSPWPRRSEVRMEHPACPRALPPLAEYSQALPPPDARAHAPADAYIRSEAARILAELTELPTLAPRELCRTR